MGKRRPDDDLYANWEMARLEAFGSYGGRRTGTYLSERPCKDRTHGPTPTRHVANGVCVKCSRGPRVRLPGTSGGNTTHGENRRGNRNGRKPLYPPGTLVCSMSFKVSEDLYCKAMILGRGNASTGMRMGTEYAYAMQKPALPETVDRFAIAAKIKQEKSDARFHARIARTHPTDPSILAPSWDDMVSTED